jgi:hypothetical protein
LTQPIKTQPIKTQPIKTQPTRAGTPELIADYACETGEDPLWHPIEKQLYWTDIPAGRLFRYDPASGRHEQCYQGRPIGRFTIQADGSLLLFMDRGTVAVWRHGAVTELVAEIPEERGSRFNDVIADPCGRVFCGTMSSEQGKGKLDRRNCDGSLQVMVENVGCCNGMAFTLDRSGFFHTDSFAGEISRFDYDVEHGSLHHRRLFARFAKADGMPGRNARWSYGRQGRPGVVCLLGWRLHRPPPLRRQRAAKNFASHAPGFQLNLWRRRLPRHLRHNGRRTSQEPQRSGGRRVVSDSQRSSRGAGILLAGWDFIDLRTE